MRVPKRRGEEWRISQQTDDLYYSKEAIDRMKRELDTIESTLQPTAIAETQRTGEMGDLSENAAYQIAKANLRRLNTRILTLRERLKSAKLIEAQAEDGIIRIGSRVRLKAEGKELTFEILGSHESNPSRGRISYLSPLGCVLLGKSAGEYVIFQEKTYEILSVA